MDGSIGGSQIESYVMAAMALIMLAQRVVAITPGKRDDEIANKLEKVFRVVMDALAGQHGDRADPGMIKPKKEE